MSDLKIQGVVEMTSDGAERAFDRIGQKADSMATKVTQTSAQAGQAVDQIGTGANRSAEEFTRAEGRIVSAIKRATTELQNLGKTASQRLELRIDTQGLDRAKFEPLLANLRELEAAQSRVAAGGRTMGGGLQNASYQLQDFIVQVNGGTDATRALAMQLPQMLAGFGAAGAAIGVVAALLPNLIALFSDSADGAKSLDDAMSGLSDAVGDVGQAVKTFDMTGLYEQFNAANDVTRQAIIEQSKFQLALIETEKLVARKSFGKSVDGLGEYSIWDKIKFGAIDAATMRASTDPVPIRDDAALQAEKLADQLGVTKQIASELLPVLRGLEQGSVDVGDAFNRFGTKLLSGNKESIALAKSLRDLARGELDAASASKAVEEALERMAKGHVRTKKETDEAAKASKAYADETQRMAESARELVASLLGQSSGLSADFFKKWETLGQAYKAGAISLQDLTNAQAALLAQQPAMKQAAKDAEDYGKALRESVGALEDRALVLETELQNYGLTKSQIERTTVARLEEVRAMASANGATEDYLANLDREIAARKRIAEATAGVEAAEANRKAADDAAKEWQRTADNIEKALVDALMEGGKSGKEYIEGLFRTMVLRPIVQAIVQPVAGSITSAIGFGQPGASGGGSFGLPPGLGTAGIVSSGLQWAGAALGSSAIGSFGAGMAMTSSQIAGLSGAGLISGGAATAGATVAAAMPYIGAALFAAQALGLFDKKPSDKTSSATFDLGKNAVTETWDMGGKKAASQEQKDANAALSLLVGSFAKDAGLTGQILTAMGRRDGTRLAIDGGFKTPTGAAAGGVWLGDETAYNYGNGEEAIRKMLDDLVDEGTLPQATIDAWRSIKTDMLGVARDATEMVSTLALLVQGYDAATIERANLLQAEGEALESALARMVSLESALSGTALPGDALAKSIGEVVRQFDALNQAVPLSAESLGSVIDGLDLTTAEGRKTYQSLMALAPAFVEIQNAQKALYDQLYTDEQRAANLAVEVGDAFAQLGLSLPATRDEMRALIDAQDSTTEAGARMRAQLLGLVPAFSEAAAAAERAVSDAEDNLRDAYRRESSELRSTIEQFERFAKSLRDFRQQLLISDQSPLSLQARDAEVAAQFESISRKSRMGDVEAIEKLQAISTEYLNVSTESATSAEDYYRRFAKVQEVLAATESTTDRQADIASQQLAALDRQVSSLITINGSVLSVRDAIEELTQARLGKDSASAVTASGGSFSGSPQQKMLDYSAKNGSAAYHFIAGSNDYAAKAKVVEGWAERTGNAVADAWTKITKQTEDYWKSAQAAFDKGLAPRPGAVPGFASGGTHAGGLRLVGERGPELEVTGPARIYSADQTREILSGNNEEMIRELKALRAEIAEMKASTAATARHTYDTSRTLDRVTSGGNAMLTEAAA